MLFTPNYAVSYKGSFYRAGEPFEIEPADAAEMGRHGVVQPPPEPPVDEVPPKDDEPEPPEIEPAKRGGRNRKGAEQ